MTLRLPAPGNVLMSPQETPHEKLQAIEAQKNLFVAAFRAVKETAVDGAGWPSVILDATWYTYWRRPIHRRSVIQTMGHAIRGMTAAGLLAPDAEVEWCTVESGGGGGQYVELIVAKNPENISW